MRTGARESRLQVACLLASVFVAACARESDASNQLNALAKLEQFAFVPEGRSNLSSGPRSSSNQVAIDEPLLVGMYEVTREQFRVYIASAAPALDPLLQKHVERWSNANAALPASFITRDEAAGYAAWAGMRLLTSDEWSFCAISPRALAYPWADSWQQGRANTLELELWPRAPTPVGTFEGGRTATHLYDMLGNVWEWVADPLGGPTDGSVAEASGAMYGGSYLSYKRESTLLFQLIPPGTRLEDLGFRVCAPARAWLAEHAAGFQDAEDANTRLTAVGRRFGPSAVPLLNELVAAAQSALARSSLEAILGGARG